MRNTMVIRAESLRRDKHLFKHPRNLFGHMLAKSKCPNSSGAFVLCFLSVCIYIACVRAFTIRVVVSLSLQLRYLLVLLCVCRDNSFRIYRIIIGRASTAISVMLVFLYN